MGTQGRNDVRCRAGEVAPSRTEPNSLYLVTGIARGGSPAPLIAVVALVAVLAGCSSGRSCAGLGELTVQRDEARAAYALLTDPGRPAGAAGPGEVEAAHDRMHAAEAEHETLRQACGRTG